MRITEIVVHVRERKIWKLQRLYLEKDGRRYAYSQITVYLPARDGWKNCEKVEVLRGYACIDGREVPCIVILPVEIHAAEISRPFLS